LIDWHCWIQSPSPMTSCLWLRQDLKSVGARRIATALTDSGLPS